VTQIYVDTNDLIYITVDTGVALERDSLEHGMAEPFLGRSCEVGGSNNEWEKLYYMTRL